MVFEGETPMDIMVQHAKTPPVPPSERTEQDVPPDLEAVLLSCLEKEPERRPADAAELRRRLEACAAAGAWTEERARRWWEAHAPAAVDG
jgi:serine/threonine-protein kinase